MSARTILVAAPAARVGALALAFEAFGLTVVRAPVVQTEPAAAGGPLDCALGAAPYDWVVFTSARGVEAVAARAAALGLEPARLAARCAAVGPSTAAAAMAAGFPAPRVPSEFHTAAIPETLGDVRSCRVLLARADVATDELDRALAERGAGVTRVAAYITRPAHAAIPPALAASADWAVFTSASAVRFLGPALGPRPMDTLRRRAAALCIGPPTAAAARGAGFRRARHAVPHTSDGLVRLVRQEVGADG